MEKGLYAVTFKQHKESEFQTLRSSDVQVGCVYVVSCLVTETSNSLWTFSPQLVYVDLLHLSSICLFTSARPLDKNNVIQAEGDSRFNRRAGV